MASIMISIVISLMIGGVLYLFISNLLLDNVVKMIIILLVMFTSYALIGETFQSKYTD